MIINWLIKIFWNPFERLCVQFPLVPIIAQTPVVAPGVKMVVLNNVVTRFLAKFGGGFDYAVIYLIDNELFFDTGYSWGRRTLKNRIFKELNPEKVKFIVNSHDHEDHTGNNSLFLSSFPQAKIYTHPQARMNLVYPPAKPWYRRFLFGPEEATPVDEVPDTIHLESKRTLQVIHTPGHTDGHICLYDPGNKILFTGDLFISETLDTQLEEADGPKWIESLEKVLQLEINLMLDGHGVVITGDACRKKLEAKLHFLRVLRSKVHEIAAKGSMSQESFIQALNDTPGIVNFLSAGEGWMSLITSGNFSRSNLIRGFLREYLDGK